jgi:hypothetical protein
MKPSEICPFNSFPVTSPGYFFVVSMVPVAVYLMH